MRKRVDVLAVAVFASGISTHAFGCAVAKSKSKERNASGQVGPLVDPAAYRRLGAATLPSDVEVAINYSPISSGAFSVGHGSTRIFSSNSNGALLALQLTNNSLPGGIHEQSGTRCY